MERVGSVRLCRGVSGCVGLYRDVGFAAAWGELFLKARRTDEGCDVYYCGMRDYQTLRGGTEMDGVSAIVRIKKVGCIPPKPWRLQRPDCSLSDCVTDCSRQ